MKKEQHKKKDTNTIKTESRGTTTIYVGNLRYTKKEYEIKKMFLNYGAVNQVSLVKDSQTNKNTGIAFVEMLNEDDAKKAISKLNGKQVDGRTLKVSIANEREEFKGKKKFFTKDDSKTSTKKSKNPISNPRSKKNERGLDALFRNTKK
jgi:cold-inducible RNA-binding protein